MSPGLACAQCGTSLTGEEPTGHCPVCLLTLGLSAATGESLDTIEPPPEAWPDSGPPSRLFGDYELLNEIARGGMGVVYRARQIGLNRLVALKMILDGPRTSSGFIERFRIEAEAAAKLNHPNIVPIFEIGKHQGRHFFSMELFEGGDLDSRMADFALPLCETKQNSSSLGERREDALKRQQKVASLLAMVAHAVHHAHERGILHRDLKPANILFDADGQPHVTDFGLAKLVENESLLTRSGMVFGTPAYMSPEQALGNATQLTTAADIYSLGTILYHLLARRPPFQASSALETMRQVAEQEPIAPDKVNALVDRDLAIICLKCLNKSPAHRYSSALLLAHDLESWEKGETITARPTTRTEHFSRWCRRKPALASLTGAVLLLLLALVVISSIAVFRINRERNVAVSERKKAIEELWQSYLNEARASRWSGKSGQRFESLRAITNAAAIRNSVALRNEAICCLTLPDVFPIAGGPQIKTPLDRVTIDFPRDRYMLAESDGTVTIRRLKDDAILFSLPVQSSRAEFGGLFSPDGRQLALGYHDGVSRIWDLETRKVLCQTDTRILGAAYGPDSHTFCFSTADGHVVSLDPTHPDVQVSRAVPTPISAVHWNRDGTLIAGIAGITGKEVFVLELSSGNVIGRFSSSKPIFGLAWHPDGVSLAFCGDDRLIHVVNVRTGKELISLAGHLGAVTAVNFNPDGTLLASDSWDGQLRIWDFPRGKELIRATGGAEGIDFSPDGQRLAVYSYSQSRVQLYELAANRAEVDLGAPDNQNSFGRGEALLFGPSGEWLATSVDDALTLWEPRSGKQLARFENRRSDRIHSIAQRPGVFGLAPDGFYRIPITWSHGLLHAEAPKRFIPKIPEALKGACPPEFLTKFNLDHLPALSDVSSDGRVYALVFKNRCYVFDMISGSLQAVTDTQPWMKYVSVSPDGRKIATGGWHNPNVKIWNAGTGRLEKELPTDGSSNVAFSPDGRWLITSTGAEYCFWHTSDWTPARHIQRALSGDLPGPMAFSKDGKLLAFAYTPRNVHLVSPDTGELVVEIQPSPDHQIIALAFSPDASELALTLVDAPPEIWHLGAIRRELANMGLDW